MERRRIQLVRVMTGETVEKSMHEAEKKVALVNVDDGQEDVDGN